MVEVHPTTRAVRAKSLSLHSAIPDRLTTFTAHQAERNRIGFAFGPRDKRADFIAAYPELDPICERIGYGWDLPLEAWSQNSSWVLAELARAAQPRRQKDEQDWTSSSIEEVVDHIVLNYHRPLRWELTRLNYLVQRLAQSHQERSLQELATGFELLRDSLLVHLLQEEIEAFPLCIQLDRLSHEPHPKPDPKAGDILHFMAAGHLETVDDMTRLMQLAQRAKDINDPDIAVVVDGLAAIRDELIVHTRLENDVLLPAALFLLDLVRTRSH